MYTKSVLALFLAAGLALPGVSHADKWYHSKVVWGGGGLLVGSTIGYIAGRESARPRYYDPCPPVYTSYRSYRYDCAPRYYSPPPRVVYNPCPPVVYRETRVFPVYRTVEVYPVASTEPIVYTPQTVSLAQPVTYQVQQQPAMQQVAPARAESEAAPPRDVNITIGDNNQNVNITFGKEQEQAAEPQPVYEVRPVVNNARTLGPNRVVDTRIVKSMQNEAAPSSSAPGSSADQQN